MEFGFEVGVADTPERTLRMFDEYGLPDFLLIDVTMPEGKGKRLSEALQLDPRYAGMQIIEMAGKTVNVVSPTQGGLHIPGGAIHSLQEVIASLQ